jgi:hypothetical protein
MRRDIVTYDSNFGEHEQLIDVIPDILHELKTKTDLFRKQIEAIKPKQARCFDDLTLKYNELAQNEKMKSKRDKGTRAILAMARRIMDKYKAQQ